MDYHCSRCHERFQAPPSESEGELHGLHCPRCKAEAGLEPVKGAPLPMILFAAFLGTAAVATAVSGVVALTSG
jgi:hypothetical protein